jgi:hypothetical protein
MGEYQDKNLRKVLAQYMTPIALLLTSPQTEVADYIALLDHRLFALAYLQLDAIAKVSAKIPSKIFARISIALLALRLGIFPSQKVILFQKSSLVMSYFTRYESLFQ